jgi:hypothetical protein
VAWTSDAAGLWTKDWLRVPGANRFWANLVSWTFPAGGTSRLFITASSSQGLGRISVTTPSSLGANPNVTARVVDPQLHSETIQLEPSAPGQFGGSFQEGGQGAYFVTVEAHGASHGEAGQIGLDVPYSPEYRATGVNMTFLQALAAAGGGSVITRPQDAWLGNVPSVMAEYDLTLWLLLLAILLLPVDIGVRRLIMSRRDLAALVAAIPLRRTAAPAEEPAVATLSALRARRAQREAVVPQPIKPSAPRAAPFLDGHGARTHASTVLRAANRPEDQTAEDADEEESTASKLLAAKRSKQ